MQKPPDTPSSSATNKAGKKPESSAPNYLLVDKTYNLRNLEEPSDEVKVAQITAQSEILKKAIEALVITMFVAAGAMTLVVMTGHNVDPLREFFLTITAGEIGLVAGLYRGS